MTQVDDISRIQAAISNSLDRNAIGTKSIAGVIGDAPSQYSKSPALWNAAFQALSLNAVYLAFDVEEDRVAEFLTAVKKSDGILGLNVTVPHKLKVINYLDQLDDQAKRINAVNTIVRTKEGKLIGYNTDGIGFLDSLLQPQPKMKEPFLTTLKNMKILLLGAGGAARAAAFSLGEALREGKLWISNRTIESARALSQEINQGWGNAKPVGEGEIADFAPQADLIINCTTKGQGGLRKNSEGNMIVLEPYSALAPANPAIFPEVEGSKPEFHRRWMTASSSDIEINNRIAMDICLKIPSHVAFYDMIYYPEETVFLRQGRTSGHRTLNGKSMIVAQAAHAFFDQICKEILEKNGKLNQETYRQILETMNRAW